MRSVRIAAGFLLCAAVTYAQQYVISTVAGGAPPPAATQAPNAIASPTGIALDSAGNTIFVAESCVYRQYRSLNNFDAFVDFDAAGGLAGARTQIIVAHLALDPAEIDPASARTHALVENLVEDHVMKGFPVLRGE